ncbi:hypothetical protein L1049_015957 [Liquidambar formosana]|uniref:Uncharacterized protein n=1 Tax=Liquidambar formosana TaxID=63359 RepID=A0AAP0S4G5_LIQFO
MRLLPVYRGVLLGFSLSLLLFTASFCHADEKAVEVVGIGECTDCAENNVKSSHAFSGLRVTIDCKRKNGENFKTRGVGELDDEGKFGVSLPQEIVKDGKLKEECFAQLHSASALPCPAHDGLQASKIVFKSKTDGKHTFGVAGKLKFSPVTCASAFFFPFYKPLPLPKLPPFKPLPMFHHPPLKGFGHPFPFPPIHKKHFPPPIPIYKKPLPPPVPIYKKPLPPPVPIYKKPLPPPIPKIKKPLPPPIPVYKKPHPPPVPIYKKPLPPPVPIYKKPLPPPIPKIKKPHPPPVPIYKKPLPPPVPIYKKPLPPPIPKIKKPHPPPIPKIKKPCPPPIPVYKKPHPPPVPIYKKPLPPPVPIYKKPLPPPVPIYKKPLPPLPPYCQASSNPEDPSTTNTNLQKATSASVRETSWYWVKPRVPVVAAFSGEDVLWYVAAVSGVQEPVKKLKDNHAWFLDTVSLFKPPNQKSREALNSQEVKIGSHQLTIQSQLKDAALRISDSLCLDEVQSYILVERSVEHNNVPVIQEFLHVVLLQYYIERQCLLKCTGQILMHALYVGAGSKEGNVIREEALKLISDGLESKLLSVLQDLLSSSHPEHMDVDLFTLWAEETLTEDSLVLDILFLAYYESLCTCTGEQWKKLCSLYKGCIAFSLTNVQEIDAIISGFNAFETKEAGPLILTWAVFLCLISSLPGKEENNVLMEIDHVGYVRQAFEAASLSYFLEILQSDILKDSDGPVAGYRSVLRTFVSAFIASYEINLQLEDNTLKLILDILSKIYRGEESLCNQFWDRDSFIDGPIRCLLCNLEGEFPIRTVELICFLSALSEGPWPAECVYNFLDKSVGISTWFEISSDSLVDNISQIVETQQPLQVPGIEGLLIPSKTRGHVLKVYDGNTALVRWEYAQSGVFVLLLRLAQDLYSDSSEEVLVTLDLFCRLVSFNTAVCIALMGIDNSMHVQATHMNGQIEKNMWCRVNVVEIICTLIRNLSPNRRSAVVMSTSVNILAKMLKCSPSHVTAIALKANVFDMALKTNILDVGFSGSSSGSWLLSGKLAKMLLIDSEQNDNCCPLTISVLDFTMQLVETGVENDVVLALVVFSLQYVLVNHEYWRYKVKNVRWKVTLKVLEVMKKCIMSISYSQKVGEVARDILLCDSSIHNAVFRIICTTPQALEKRYVSRLYEPMEIEGLELAICSVLDILFNMLLHLSKDISSSLPVFHQAVLSSTTKPIPAVVAVISLISYFRNTAIQVGAARVLSTLFIIADYSQQYLFGNAFFGLDDKQGSKKASLVDAFLQYVERSNDLINSNPRVLLNVLNFLKALWQGAAQYTDILEWLKSSGKFWKQLSNSILLIAIMKAPLRENHTDTEALRWPYNWCESSVLGDLIKLYASCEYDNGIYIRAKLRGLPAFSELLAQYSQHGYSEGKELSTLILSDLYYHLQGELEGRKIDPGPFKELSQFLLESKLLQTYQHEYDGDLFEPAKDVYLFDTTHLRVDLGLDMWDHSEWRASKAIAETMLLCMQDANSMVLLATAKLSALKALITILAMYEKDSVEKKKTTVGGNSEQLILSCIDHTCQCFCATLESLAPVLDASEDILNYLAAQVELILHLSRSVQKSLSLPVCILVLKTSGSGLRVLCDFRPSVAGVKTTMKLLLMLLLSSVEFGYFSLRLGEETDESVEDFAEVSNVSLGLLPILCNCVKTAEHCNLSLTTIDLILRGFLTPNTWFPIIQKHLHLPHVILKLQDKNCLSSIPIILKFLLTLAQVRGGAEMLLNAGFFSSLRALVADLSDGGPFSVILNERSLSNSSDKIEKPQHIWGLSLAVVTAMICSLGDHSSCIEFVDNVITYFFSEKAYLIFYHLNAPDFPSDDHDKKRARAQKTQISLTALKETEHTLMLMCVLVKHWNSWVKAMKEMDSELRERSIHLLAFISRGNQRLGESPSRTAPLLCPPILKEEFDYYKKPSFVNSRNGWFALSPLGCGSKSKLSAVSSKTTALSIKDQATENNDLVSQTFFSDTTSLQIYRISFFLLKFLCLQAEGAAKRAEEVGFVDLAHFPELPMPEILHGLQDQAIAIVTELCEANKSKYIQPEIRSICLLLLQILEMSLYLELCVSQICGIRPVLGRVEDFSKEVKLLIKAMEGHAFLKAWIKSLKQIISLVYPALLQSEGIL